MSSPLRTDPVTLTVSVHPDFSGKPLPSRARNLPPELSPCPFCLMGHEVLQGAGSVSDGSSTRDVVARDGDVYVIKNRWSIFADPSGTCELVIPARHTTCFEDLGVAEAVSFLELIARRVAEITNEFASAVAFVNVGVASGSSIAHLHAQIIGAPVPPTVALARLTAGSGIVEDIAVAGRENLVVARDGDLVTYLPFAPSGPGEIRIVGGDLPARARALVDVLTRLGNVVQWPYNIVFHAGERSVIQILPRVDPGIMYPTMLGTVIALVDLHELAEALRNA